MVTPKKPSRTPRVKVATSTEMTTSAYSSGHDAPYLLESNTFERMLQSEKNKAERVIFDLTNDIERLEAEISQRVQRKNDLEMVVARIDAALGVSTVDTRFTRR